MSCLRCLLWALVPAIMIPIFASADDYRVETVDTAPEGIAKKVSMVLSGSGYRIVGSDGPVCEIWLKKEIPAQKAFKPTLNLHYPLTSGELIGVMSVPKKSEYSDFREQPIEEGVYTLRYGKQPQDGNHIGTSDFSDFLLALPAKEDKSTGEIDDELELQEISAEAAGGAHPAIFQLLPPEESKKAVSLEHESDHDFWILQLQKGEESPLTLRLIVVGHGEE